MRSWNFLSFAIALALPLAPSGAQAQEGSRLACQAGGGMLATVTDDGAARLAFIPAGEAAATAPPAPGYCAWFDRGFREGEPSLLLYTGDLNGLHYLIDSLFAAGSFTVHAYNDNQGALVVTALGD